MPPLKIDGEKCKKVIDFMIAKQPELCIFKRIRLWFRKRRNMSKNKSKIKTTKEHIEKGDYVLVVGEGDEVFRVVGSTDKAIFLSTGIAEPKEKCTRIPKEFHNKLSSVSHTYLDFDSIDQIMEEKGGK
jgi:hypothetical protein